MGRLAILAISLLVGGSHALTSHNLQKEHDNTGAPNRQHKANLHKKAQHLHERKLSTQGQEHAQEKKIGALAAAHERKLRIRANQAMHFQKKKHEYEEALQKQQDNDIAHDHQENTQSASAEVNQAKQTKHQQHNHLTVHEKHHHHQKHTKGKLAHHLHQKQHEQALKQGHKRPQEALHEELPDTNPVDDTHLQENREAAAPQPDQTATQLAKQKERKLAQVAPQHPQTMPQHLQTTPQHKQTVAQQDTQVQSAATDPMQLNVAQAAPPSPPSWSANGPTQHNVVQAALPLSSTPKLQLSVKQLAKEINGMAGSMENKPITTLATEALTPALDKWNTFIDKGVRSGVDDLNTFIDKAIDRIPENKLNLRQEEQDKAAADLQKKIDKMPANPQMELLKMIFNPKVPSPYGLGIIRDFSHEVPKDVSFVFSHDDYRIHPKRGEDKPKEFKDKLAANKEDDEDDDEPEDGLSG